MTKTFFAMMAVAATLASCSKNTEIDTPEVIHPDGPQVRLTLGGEDAASNPATRTFFDDKAAAETWENHINTLTLYAFKNSGEILLKHSLSAAEVSSKSATFSLPNSVAGTDCSFYVVANADYGDVTTATELDALTEKVQLEEYNGAYHETATSRKRMAGFVMTGKSITKIATKGSPTTVSVILKRTVAKIALRVKVDAAFGSNNGGGTITINSVKLSKASSESNSFYKTNFAPRTSLYTFTQTPKIIGGYFNGCFYVYENLSLAAGDRVTLMLTGYFDADNNAATTDDRTDVKYTFELSGTGSGGIFRNGYYRVDATIKGLAGDGVATNITAANWETPVTQTINLGN
jgi:hypothetical protein